ncbi:hypothetical protein [Bordetella sp. LUAb4]|uniref:hypothetical protein n=1 Tax=Bordetella sp. LUAb4 TaxID=2843195 RepID=UPI001E5DCF51|nr:hypothetical protein [Bordetella sp. LUAb4]
MVKPVAPVNASVAAVRISQLYDSVRRGDDFDASPAQRRATVKQWASYKKTGKKQYIQRQRKKTPRELFEAFVLSANGAQALNQEKLNANYSKERREARQRIEGASNLFGDAALQVIESRENSARRADEHRVRVEQKNGSASSKDDGRSASAREEDAKRYSAKLIEARETVKGLSIGVVEKAANSPLELMTGTTGIQGLRAEDIQRLCVEALLILIQPTIKMMLAVATLQPDKKKAADDFDGVVSFSAKQNEQGVAPRQAIKFGVERADSRTLFASACSIGMPWPGHNAPAVLAF